MLPLDDHIPKAPTALSFCCLYPYQTSFHAFSGLPSWLGPTKLSQQRLHNVCIPCLVLWLSNAPKKTAIKAQTSLSRPTATMRVQVCYTLPL